MGNKRRFRFGLEHDGRYSQYFTFGLVSRADDIYVSSERTGDSLHISLHASSAHWHVAVTQNGVTSHRSIDPPAPQLPGVRRAMQVILPASAARYDTPGRAAGVEWLTVDGDEKWAVVNVFVEDETADPTWISLHAPTGSVLATAELASGRKVSVLAWSQPGIPGHASFPATEADKERIRNAIRTTGVFALVFGQAPDGSHVVLELTAEEPAEPPAPPEADVA